MSPSDDDDAALRALQDNMPERLQIARDLDLTQLARPLPVAVIARELLELMPDQLLRVVLSDDGVADDLRALLRIRPAFELLSAATVPQGHVHILRRRRT